MRDHFLKTKWRRYPPAQANWLDVSDFLVRERESESSPGRRYEVTAERALVCGRLSGAPGHWRLEANGSQIQFNFAPKCRWLSSQLGEDFDPEIVRSGDLLCLDLAPRGDDSQGEASFLVEGCLLLAPAVEPFTLRSSFDQERARQWSDFLAEIREFFKLRKFIEARTPTLVPSPGTEPFLDPFHARWEFGSESRRVFMPTSPEFHLKKLLAAGWTRIFELKTCFRNGEAGPHHQPEFLMLEWYRSYSDLARIADDVAELFEWLHNRLGTGVARPLKRTTMVELFARTFPGFVLRPDTTRAELVALCERAGVRVAESDSWDDVFFRIFIEKIEHTLGLDGPELVHGYPPSQAALARIGADGFADRFEIYWRGFEIANAFHELNDVDENRARFAEDAQRKRALGKPSVPVDRDLLAALAFGMPPSGGIALGVDRLFLAFHEIERIDEARAFPFDVRAFEP